MNGGQFSSKLKEKQLHANSDTLGCSIFSSKEVLQLSLKDIKEFNKYKEYLSPYLQKMQYQDKQMLLDEEFQQMATELNLAAELDLQNDEWWWMMKKYQYWSRY